MSFVELTQLRYFYEAACSQHITKSAEKLNVAQPALTKSIRKLEQELGVPLFVRRGRNVFTTPYGEYLRDRVEPILQAVDSLARDMESMAREEEHTIRLSVNAASTMVTQAVIDYKKINPEAHFQLMSKFENGMFDVEISTEPSDGRSVRDDSIEYLFTERIFLAVPKVEKYMGKSSIRLTEVRSENFISLSGSKPLRAVCEAICRDEGFSPNIIFESDSPTAVKNMIGANVGVGFWPEFSWGIVDNEHVILLPIDSPSCKRDIVLRCNELKRDSEHVRQFFEFLKGYFVV